ncbi:MAG: hypothetical protein L3J79_10275, partial [Candidatus Marinimicrobia bacterium]|nr:hypothetical protein [Candidatus Neomarinimicrobiota bacterium]
SCKTPQSPFIVIPAKAGIQGFTGVIKILDPRIREDDDFCKRLLCNKNGQFKPKQATHFFSDGC